MISLTPHLCKVFVSSCLIYASVSSFLVSIIRMEGKFLPWCLHHFPRLPIHNSCLVKSSKCLGNQYDENHKIQSNNSCNRTKIQQPQLIVRLTKCLISHRQNVFYSRLCADYTSENASSVFEDDAVEFHHIHHSIS